MPESQGEKPITDEFKSLGFEVASQDKATTPVRWQDLAVAPGAEKTTAERSTVAARKETFPGKFELTEEAKVLNVEITDSLKDIYPAFSEVSKSSDSFFAELEKFMQLGEKIPGLVPGYVLGEARESCGFDKRDTNVGLYEVSTEYKKGIDAIKVLGVSGEVLLSKDTLDAETGEEIYRRVAQELLDVGLNMESSAHFRGRISVGENYPEGARPLDEFLTPLAEANQRLNINELATGQVMRMCLAKLKNILGPKFGISDETFRQIEAECRAARSGNEFLINALEKQS